MPALRDMQKGVVPEGRPPYLLKCGCGGCPLRRYRHILCVQECIFHTIWLLTFYRKVYRIRDAIVVGHG
jgi:hypothetical protein